MTGAATRGLLLHLRGPLQSWGEGAALGGERTTFTSPTRSGLIGLIAAALGRRRDQPLGDLISLQFTVRIDRPGTLLRDFQTVGGGMPRHLTVITAEGKRRAPETATVVSNRYYRADAAFTVAVTAPDPPLLDVCAQALREPHWPPYLGRRSCPPALPVFLATVHNDPVQHLIDLPIARAQPRDRDAEASTVLIEFRSEAPLTPPAWPDGPDASPTNQLYTELNDEPVSFTPQNRQYRSRPVYRRHLHLPAHQCAGYGIDYLNRLQAYLNTTHAPENEPS